MTYWEKRTAESVTVIAKGKAEGWQYDAWIKTGKCLSKDPDDYNLPRIKIVKEDTMDCVFEESNACSIFCDGKNVIYISQFHLNLLEHEYVHIYINCGNRCHGRDDFDRCGQ
jgi:hypothetical protein